MRGYSTRMKMLRPVVSVLGGVLGTATLPRVGSPLRQCYASHVAVRDEDLDVFAALLRAARSECARRGMTHLTMGFDERHPFAAVIERSCRPVVSRSVVYTVHWDGVPSPLPPNDSLVHLEVATL